MKKKVQIRFQTTQKTTQSINHDFRKSKVSYLRDDMFHNQFENVYFSQDPNKIKLAAQKSFEEYNRIYKEKNGRNLQKGRQSDHLQSVVTLSPIINEWLESGIVTKQELDECFKKSIPLVLEKIHDIVDDDSIKLSHAVIHYDEKTPHMHIGFSNHTKDGQAVFHLMRNSGRLSEFQDIVGDVFKQVGLERGDRKSQATHKGIRQMHQEEIKQLKAELRETIKLVQGEKKELKKTVEDKAELKQKLDLYDRAISEARETLKSKKTDIDALKYQKSVLKQSMSDLIPQKNLLEEEIKRLRDEKERLEKRNAMYLGQNKELTKQIQDLTLELTELQLNGLPDNPISTPEAQEAYRCAVVYAKRNNLPIDRNKETLAHIHRHMLDNYHPQREEEQDITRHRAR
jgi:gas vesicle protein